MKQSIILFDGVCKLCHFAVIFIIKRDPHQHFVFCPMQSVTGVKFCQQYAIDHTDPDSFVLIKNQRSYTQSRAAFEVCKQLSGAWRLCAVLRFLPQFITDIPYRWVARHRYRIWGKYSHCLLPTDNIKSRFLD